MRVMALWFPDWPVQAAVIAGQVSAQDPIVILERNVVWVCNAVARARGIRRGMSVRHVHALADEVTTLMHNQERDERIFADIISYVADIAANVEIMRAGLAIVEAEVAANFHGGEERVAELIMNAVAKQGSECCAGLADEVFTAVLAARSLQVVPPGGSKDFLARQPLALLAAEPVLRCNPATVQLWHEVGLITLGDFVALGSKAIATRFGAEGMHCYRIATAYQPRGIATVTHDTVLQVQYIPEEPITRVDSATFAARALAVKLQKQLRTQNLVCMRIKLEVIIGDEILERTWRTYTALDERAIADRVRWQLESWLTTVQGKDAQCEGITQICILPLECQYPQADLLFGQCDEQHEVLRAAARVQSLLGMEQVVQPYSVSGRGVADRITFVPFGESYTAGDTQRSVGALVAPLPAQIMYPAVQCQFLAKSGIPVSVTDTGVLDQLPYKLYCGTQEYLVTHWAGPWFALGKWWSGEQSCARLQVVGEDTNGRPHAWVLVWAANRWSIEARYG